MRLFLFFLLAGAGVAAALAQTTPAPQEFQSTRTASYYLAPVENSGVSGYLQATEEASGGTRLVVTLQGVAPGERYALELFEGDCGPDRRSVTQLEAVPNIEGDPFSSLSESNMPFAAFAEGDYFLYVYGGPTNAAPLVACGEVGLGTNASGFGEPATPAATEPATPAAAPTTVQPAPPNLVVTPAPPSATVEGFGSPRSLSYALSPVEGSGVSGNLQVTEHVEGGTRFTVSLSGIVAGQSYAVVLFEGDCGPDRALVARLQNVDDSDGSPFSSITESELGFDAITSGDHFAYVFGGEPGSALLACGEVGLGASR